MKTGHRPLVASLVWRLPSGLHEAQADVVRRLGYPHRYLSVNETIPADVDIVLIQGPYGSLLHLARQLADLSPEHRPVLAYWFQQSLNMVNPEWLRRRVARAFSELHRASREAGIPGTTLNLVEQSSIGQRGKRLSYLGDILWLHDHGLLDVLALSSTLYADYLDGLGIDSLLVPRGYHRSYGHVLGQRRDFGAVWMGKLRNRRRRNAVHWLRRELEKRGHQMHVYDGEESGFIFGDKRTQILNRAWFVLDVLPDPTWELSIRYYIAAANGAVVLKEPGMNKYPFVPGRHLVECPIELMPDKITYYLEHQREWQTISSNMLSLIKNDLTLEQSVAHILGHAEAILENRRSVSL